MNDEQPIPKEPPAPVDPIGPPDISPGTAGKGTAPAAPVDPMAASAASPGTSTLGASGSPAGTRSTAEGAAGSGKEPPAPSLPEEPEGSMEGLLRESTQLLERLETGQPTEVLVVSVEEEFLLVDLGLKWEGQVPRAEFPGKLPGSGSMIPVVLVKKGGAEIPTLLSYRKAVRLLAWQRAVEDYRLKRRVRAKVLRPVKGGFFVALRDPGVGDSSGETMGTGGFLPSSQAGERPGSGSVHLAGQEIDCYITEIQEDRQHVVVSRRQVLQ